MPLNYAPRVLPELGDPNPRFEIAYLHEQPVGLTRYHHRCDRHDTANAAQIERVYIAQAVVRYLLVQS